MKYSGVPASAITSICSHYINLKFFQIYDLVRFLSQNFTNLSTPRNWIKHFCFCLQFFLTYQSFVYYCRENLEKEKMDAFQEYSFFLSINSIYENLWGIRNNFLEIKTEMRWFYLKQQTVVSKWKQNFCWYILQVWEFSRDILKSQSVVKPRGIG